MRSLLLCSLLLLSGCAKHYRICIHNANGTVCTKPQTKAAARTIGGALVNAPAPYDLVWSEDIRKPHQEPVEAPAQEDETPKNKL